ncbi:MAG: XRE family transcriptional regulator [Clostridiales bacterium]|nr:XRE family transcriptional regulator [Clostridiales bacterium]MCC8100649.1 XRE family transcriptional regulator [Clostridiales bacterium]
MTINEAVAVNVRRERKAKGLSLDRAAKLTGVSKSMLGQIERGEVNPTVSVLYKIAAGLELECSTLLEIPVPAVEFVSSTNSVTRKEDGGKVVFYSLFPSDAAQSFSIYRLRLLTSGRYEAPARQPGTMIFITVYYGTLLLTVDGEQYRLTRGDSLRFRADQPYELYNRDIQVCECQVTVNAPQGGGVASL